MMLAVSAAAGPVSIPFPKGQEAERLLFVKRKTYTSDHYYTEYVNSKWTPGGNLCVLDLETGKSVDLVPELENGVFGRFDLDFDARKIVFAFKAKRNEGYRIYEIDVDPETGGRTGSKLRRLTLSAANEDDLYKKYRRGTDDMHPAYLPDGHIVFVSTRIQYGILCNGQDKFTTTVLYRMDGKGKNMRPLTNSSVSEASPTLLEDGRILYTRWEYVDKGGSVAKCLWAMNQDGSRSVEIYGANINYPPTFIFGRPIPRRPSEYVVLGAPHMPATVGTVIRLDMTKNIRTRGPMTYMTPDVDIKGERGFKYIPKSKHAAPRKKGPRKRGSGGKGSTVPLFRDPFPLSRSHFLVSHKPIGESCNHPSAFGLYVLEEGGQVSLICKDETYSCWQPMPLRPRRKPPVTALTIDQKLADKKLAACVVTDVYHGMENVERGTIKYIRVLEQVPRPWAARRRWKGDTYGQQHAVISDRTHLGLKVQHGVVPVEKDGSAHFVVPAMANIFFQALDENHMSVQTERTYVNYMPGETRSCVGCHETPNDTPANTAQQTPIALTRAASVPGPQPGEKSGRRPLDFPLDVQPVLDAKCIKCHGADKPKADLDLTGAMTTLFSRSYQNLLARQGLIARIGELQPKGGNVHYLPARSLGSHNSILIAMHAPGKVKLADKKAAARAAKLAEVHKKVKLSPEQLLKISNWVDTNAQYYGMYWGRKNLEHKDHPNFRPVPTFKRATSYTSLIAEDER